MWLSKSCTRCKIDNTSVGRRLYYTTERGACGLGYRVSADEKEVINAQGIYVCLKSERMRERSQPQTPEEYYDKRKKLPCTLNER